MERQNPITEDERIKVGAMPCETNINSILLHDLIVNLTMNPAWYHSYCKPGQYIHLPIANGRAPSQTNAAKVVNRITEVYRKGGTVYIHCQGGHGRAGTIGALVLGKLCGYSAAQAIQVIEHKRNTLRPYKLRNFIPTPETAVQVELIVSMLGLRPGESVPDRSDMSWLKRLRDEKRSS